MSTPTDLYLTTTSRLGLLQDLLALGLGSITSSLSFAPLPGVSIDYIGRMVKTPATYDYTAFPPKEVTPAVWYDGERANIRLTGADAEALAEKIRAATLADTAVLTETPTTPKRTWA